MAPLPPLTEKIASGAESGLEFERLMHQLLLTHGQKNDFLYQPRSGAGGDGGIDGLAPKGGVPGLERPVIFQYKWLWGEIFKGSNAQQIQESFRRAAATVIQGKMAGQRAYWVLVTPLDLTPKERTWVEAFRSSELEVLPWGWTEIENLLRQCPALLARYYPHEARTLLPGYDGGDFRELAGKYRQRIALQYRRLRTLGLPPETLREKDARAEIQLRDVFVPLELLEEGRDAGEPLSRPLAEVVRAMDPVVVLGDPGTGKSTLLTFLALLYSGEAALDGVEPPPSHHLPLLVPLRDLVRCRRQQPDLTVLDYLAQRAKTDHELPQTHPAFFEQALRMGEAILLLDGLDEVGRASSRRQTAHLAASLHAEYPDCPLWVTSRIYGYSGDARLSGEVFRHHRVVRLGDEQVNDFIHRWYQVQQPHNPRERQDLEESLRGAVHRTPSVRRLAENPLLLTLMAFIHQGLRRLPQDRGELYEKCVEMLLKTWQEARQGEGEAGSPHPFDKLQLDLNRQKDYLAHLAFHLQENSPSAEDDVRGLIEYEAALRCLSARHLEKARRRNPDLSAAQARSEMKDFLDYISDRTGLLIDRGGGQISFLHLSFQEYLAAWIFTCTGRPAEAGFFLRHLGDPAWEEVLLLRLYIVLRTAGGGTERTFDGIIQAMLRRLSWWDLTGVTAQRRQRAATGWLTLARVLRDNLDLQPGDQCKVLGRALNLWLRDPKFEGTWFSALEDICLLGSQAAPALRELLEASWSQGKPARAIPSLYLQERLFGFPPDAAERLRQHPWLEALLPDLVVLADRPGMAGFLGERATVVHWLRTLDALDDPQRYLASVARATAAPGAASRPLAMADLALRWSRICTDLASRQKFGARIPEDMQALRGRPGQLTITAPHHSVALPASALSDPGARIALAPAALRESTLSAPRLAAATSDAAEGSVEATLRSILGQGFAGLSRQWIEPYSQAVDDPADQAPILQSAEATGRYFGRYFGRDFWRYFGRDFWRDFGRDFWRDFGSPFWQELGIEPNTPEGEKRLAQRLQSEGGFLTLLEDDAFWAAASLASKGSIDTQAHPSQVGSELRNPLALPLLLLDLFRASAWNHGMALGRYLNSGFPRGKFWWTVVDRWLDRNPIDVYPVAFAWKNLAAQRAANGGRLTGPDGALCIAHAAYAALMTGIHCDGPVWQKLLEERDREDPLIEISYHLHEICHFRDAQTHDQELARLVKAASAQDRELLRLAGFRG